MTEAEWLLSSDPSAMLHCLTAQSIIGNIDGIVRRPSNRRLRLFACACCRLTQSMHYPEAQAVVNIAEEVAENSKMPAYDAARLMEARNSIEAIGGWFWCVTNLDIAVGLNQTLYQEATERIGYGNSAGSYLMQMAFALRSIVGNPFRPVQIIPAAEPNIWEAIPILARAAKEKNYFAMVWVNDTVRGIAENIYEKRDWDGLPILADALEDQGCCNEDMLRHLRGYQRCGGNGNSERVGNDHIDHFDKYFCDCDGTGWIKENPLIRCRGDWVIDIILSKE